MPVSPPSVRASCSQFACAASGCAAPDGSSPAGGSASPIILPSPTTRGDTVRRDPSSREALAVRPSAESSADRPSAVTTVLMRSKESNERPATHDGPDAPLGVETAIELGHRTAAGSSRSPASPSAVPWWAPRPPAVAPPRPATPRRRGRGQGPGRRRRRDPVHRRVPVGTAQQLQPVRRQPRLAHGRRPEPAHLRVAAPLQPARRVAGRRSGQGDPGARCRTPSCCRCRTAPSGPTAAS